jgi:hypothetical protein
LALAVLGNAANVSGREVRLGNPVERGFEDMLNLTDKAAGAPRRRLMREQAARWQRSS